MIARALKFAELPFAMSRPFIAPPDVPAERARALREAFMATMTDAAFVAELDKIHFDDLSPIDGDAIVDLLRAAMQTPKAVIERYNRIEKASG